MSTTRFTGSCAEPDHELITLVRKGNVAAYRALYERHRHGAYRQAGQLTRCRSEADDLVAEAFVKTLDTLLAGGGPDSAFRAYLLTAIRHIAYDKTRRDRRVELTEDVGTIDAHLPFTDPALAGLEQTLAAQAFVRLPPHWQSALTFTVLYGLSPASAARWLGLTPNGMSAMAYRARGGLCTEYLQAHLTGARVEPTCQPTVGRLGAWVRGGLTAGERAQIGAHLEACEPCRGRERELAAFNPRRRPRTPCTAKRGVR